MKNDMPIGTCKRNKGQNAYGRKMKVICGKTASFKQDDGLPLCTYHYNKWIKKNKSKNTLPHE